MDCCRCKSILKSCPKCEAGLSVKMCKGCYEGGESSNNRKCCGKVHPYESPKGNLEPPSLSFSGEGFHSPDSPTRFSPCRSDDEGEDSTSNFFDAPNEYFHDASDLDSSIMSSRDAFYSFVSTLSSPSPTISRLHLLSSGEENYEELEKRENSSSQNNRTFYHEQISADKEEDKNLLKPWNFETNSHIWFPPPPEDIYDEVENMFTYEDDDDDDTYIRTADMDTIAPAKDLDGDLPLKSLILGHFRALVSQLLRSQGIVTTNDSSSAKWLEVITTIAWQATKYIMPDTSRGGSMDPCEYIKVKCAASGHPGESKLVKGIVCTKNMKHKRMMSQYKNARLMVLGGALEYQRAPSQLESVQTLLQQENDHVKTIVSKIEAHRPNILLVEKSVSSCALKHLLAKEISLVLNIKRPLLEKIARCTGASLVPSTDQISIARLGHCDLFHLEKVTEEHEPVNQLNRKPSKTLMYFENCPRRLGCTIVLRGSTREELKKVKHVVHYAVFAAYHLSLETSYLIDEGASLADMDSKSEKTSDSLKPPDYDPTSHYEGVINLSGFKSGDLVLERGLHDSLSELGNYCHDYFSVPDDLGPGDPGFPNNLVEEPFIQRDVRSDDVDVKIPVKVDDVEGSGEYYLANDNHQSILVSCSSHCMMNGTVCERSKLLRVKFYGPSDKPLGRYLRDDLFDKTFLCKSCNEPAEAHVTCYTHQHANLTIKVRHLPTIKLPGARDGKIWMWHRCLRCELVEGVPPANGRVVMSDSAWGLSFGKFLELSFYNHVTGNRVANCGHSLQRDCLRFYGFGNMVASFQYSYINILSVHLPPPVLEFCRPDEHSYVGKETYELLGKAEALYAEISSVLEAFKIKSSSCMNRISDANELQKLFNELNDMLDNEKNYYKDLQQCGNKEVQQLDQMNSDIRHVNRLRHSLVARLQLWDQRLHLVEAFLKRDQNAAVDHVGLMDSDIFSKDVVLEFNRASDVDNAALIRVQSAGSTLYDRIDSAWLGVDDPTMVKNPSVRKLMGTTRVYSFDSAQRVQQRIRKGQSAYYYLLDAAGKLDFQQNCKEDNGVLVHDNEPTSMISYALSSKEYEDWILDRFPNGKPLQKSNSVASWQSFSSIDTDYMSYGSFISDDQSGGHPHFRFSFDDESNSPAKVKFSVTCYFGREFDALRRKCCPNENDFIRSLSRSRKWCAQGGKSNVYFAKSLDERFVIKQVTKTELDSFEEFGQGCFKYMSESLESQMPTCLAKILGMHQVKQMKGGKEVKKMDVMVMENLFFNRKISRVYDLKGSSRSRYVDETSGMDKVLLDMNLMETVGRNPIFVGSKAKRNLERAVWNDTSFLASVDVMDYSLLVGVDEDRKELVMGIIDFMRQYTWDKHLETWVKASGILGGNKNASPTIISPKQYKKRFRKAMTSYFLTVPDKWSDL